MSKFTPLISLGIGTDNRVVQWNGTAGLLEDAALVAPASNLLTLTASAVSTLALVISSGKTLTLTSTDNHNLTIPASGTAALLGTVNTFTAKQIITSNAVAGDPVGLDISATCTNPSSSWPTGLLGYCQSKAFDATSTVVVQKGMSYFNSFITTFPSDTLSVSYSMGMVVLSPAFSGSGISVYENYGIFIYQQGDSRITYAYGILITDVMGSAVNRALVTNAGDVIFNSGGAAAADLTAKSDNYDAIFIDASNDSVMLMSSASGKVGFYGITAVAQQTGVAVTAGGIHTALVNLGLITA